jgi:hypothetical protein
VSAVRVQNECVLVGQRAHKRRDIVVRHVRNHTAVAQSQVA